MQVSHNHFIFSKRQRKHVAHLELQAMRDAFVAQGLQDWHVAQPNLMAADEPNEIHHDDGEGASDTLTAPPQLKKPPFYAVLLFNDDYTPMEFVIDVLQLYFGLSIDRATEVMLTVHYRGKGVAGLYPRDIAETKAQQVNNHARAQGHPLLCQIEPSTD